MGEKIFVTGGAGYVGSHICKALAQAGFDPVVYDNFSNGHRAFVKWGPLVEGDIRDGDALDRAMAEHRPQAVIHCAAFIEVGESVKEPARFYDNNVGGAIKVFNAALRAGIDNVVFSSTCAVYGAPRYAPMDELHPVAPLSPYGRTKLMIDDTLVDLSAHTPLRYVSLRYFNASGADPDGEIGERHQPESHALPLAIHTALGRRNHFSIFGSDYETEDGSAVRDYIHVADLAAAHIAALRALRDGAPSNIFNLGAGIGVSVKQLVDTVQRVSGVKFDVRQESRRAGDAPILVANNAKPKELLKWSPRFHFDAVVETAFAWHSMHETRIFGDDAR